MSKLTDFYKKAATDPALKADLEAAKKRYEGQNPDHATIVAEGIALAAKHGVTLEAADFEVKKGELDEEELSAVAGGGSSCDSFIDTLLVPGREMSAMVHPLEHI
ncbi:hypothetical protein AGMMS49928_12040 [Spirochaetia bacterium]|nr:hypothetical protein AGMMS49928_12040 [Spirochaetia bacterium]